MARIIELDGKILLWMNQFAFSWMDYFLGWPTYLGDALFILPIVFLLIIIWEKKEYRWKSCMMIAAATLSSGLLVRLFKIIISRERPYAFFYNAVDKGEVVVHYLFAMGTSGSFPSGHTATVFAIAFTLNRIYKNRLLYLYPVAFWIALSRVYVAAHFPSDILAGALMGILSAWAVLSFVSRIGLKTSKAN